MVGAQAVGIARAAFEYLSERVQGGTMLRLLSKEGRTLLHVPFADGYDSHSGYPQIVAGGETYAIAWGQRLEPDAPPVISLQFIICSH